MRITVLLGGVSAERDVSLSSGLRVAAAPARDVLAGGFCIRTTRMLAREFVRCQRGMTSALITNLITSATGLDGSVALGVWQGIVLQQYANARTRTGMGRPASS